VNASLNVAASPRTTGEVRGIGSFRLPCISTCESVRGS
jgi:hypothetical protein